MKITEHLKNLETGKVALFPKSSAATVRQTIYRLQDKGFGKWATEKDSQTLKVWRVMAEVPDSVITRYNDMIEESEEETIYNEFDENGIHYISEYNIEYKDNMPNPYEEESNGKANPVTEKVWNLSISGYYNEIQISNFEDEGSEILKY
jgi:hypothetical protein